MSYKDRGVLESMLAQMGRKRIAKHFGVSEGAIRFWCKKFGLGPSVARNIGNTKYAVDRDFFRVIDTPDKAYIVGLIVTDGYVAHNATSRFWGIQLKESDASILERVRDAMSSTHPVRRRLVQQGYRPHTNAVLEIPCIDHLHQLAALGIHPNKTDHVGYVDLPGDLERDFIRGLWDGDGNINRWNFQLFGTNALIEGAKHAIAFHTGRTLAQIPKDERRSTLVGYRRDADVLQWMYHDANLVLPRKYAAYESFWSSPPVQSR